MHLDLVESPLWTKCTLLSLQRSSILCLNDPKHCPTLSSLSFPSTVGHLPAQEDTIINRTLLYKNGCWDSVDKIRCPIWTVGGREGGHASSNNRMSHPKPLHTF